MAIGARPIGTRAIGDSTLDTGIVAPPVSIALSFSGTGDLDIGGSLLKTWGLPVLGSQATFFGPRVRMYYPDFDENDWPNEQQTITVGGTGLVSFTLTFDGQTTVSLSPESSALEIYLALVALSNIGDADVSVSGPVGGPWVVTFQNGLGHQDVPTITSTPTGGSGTVTVTTTVAGASPPAWWVEGAIPEGPIDVTGISVQLVDLDNEPLTLIETSGREWQDQLATDGSGSLVAAETDAVEGESVLRYSLNGETAFQVLVNQVETVEVAQGEESDQLVNLSGPGAIAMFATASVAPEFGFVVDEFERRISEGYVADVRYFNYSSKYLVETGWKPAVYTDPQYNTLNLFGRAIGMTDLSAQELWDRPSGVPVPGGDVYFRQWFTYDGPNTITVRVEAAADDEIELWIDNVPVLEVLGVYAGGMKWTTYELSPGAHLVAWRGRNRNELRAMTVWSIGTMTSEGFFKDVIAHSDAADAICLGYPDKAPGFPVGQAFRILLLEAQGGTRQEVQGITTSFGSFYDSNGDEWPVTSELSCRMDQTLLDVIRMWGETQWDAAFASYGFEFHAWRRGQRGTNVNATWDTGDEVIAKTITRTNSPNVVIVRYEGGRIEVIDEDVTVSSKKRVVTLNMGHIRNRSQAAREGRSYLETSKTRRETVTLELDIDQTSLPEQVYTGAWVGDSPLVDGDRLRVHGINVAEQDDDFTVVPEVVSAALTAEERTYVTTKQGFPGSGGGTSRSPSPVPDVDFPAGREGTEFELGFSWESLAGSVVLKVGTDTLATLNPSAGTRETYVLAAPYEINANSKITVVVGGNASQQKSTDQGINILAFMVNRDVDAARGAASVYIAK